MEISRPSLEERAAECERGLTFSATVAYDGAPFAGFAKQPGQLTVQGELEQALGLLFRRPVAVVCAGRTDAGVHARGQVVSFDIDGCELRDRTPYNLRRSLNALICEGIVVRAVEERPRGFSARFDAQWREYKYFLATGDTPPVFTDRTAWYVGPSLDIAAMERGAAHLIGEHDFKSFCLAVSAVGKPTCRNVRSITFSRDVSSRTASSPCAATPSSTPWCVPSWARSSWWAAASATPTGSPRSSPPATAKPPAKTPPPAASSSGR